MTNGDSAKPRVLILGGLGMLGHKLCQILSPKMDVWTTVRRDADLLRSTEILDADRVLDGVDARKPDTMLRALDMVEPDAVVNCIGIVKQLPEARDPVVAIEINSLFPHRMAKLCAERSVYLIHISTDCVFSGVRGMYVEDDPSDAQDLYGRSKALGEIMGSNCLTLRTSIIGRELRGRRGLIEWFMAQKGKTVRGYTQAVFSGITSQAFAKIIGRLVQREQRLEGLYQIAAHPICKYDLLNLVKRAYSLDVSIEPFAGVVVDRSLDGTLFRTETGLAAGDWESMVGELADDPFDYDNWRQAHAA